MDAELKAKWVEALRSGEYKQCQQYLRIDGGHCCLGVLWNVHGGRWYDMERGDGMIYGIAESDSTSLDDQLSKLGVGSTQIFDLISMNDGGKSFAEIADYIEQNL